ncbi:MAG: SET domain-containing protein-lysine N-methyltransferase [Candidatus Omnitrophica bacterium]|nr:SET domain-containing protein-lysine N-methyltransferase [Candidatus Omnitrophota bacterium]
MFSTSTKSPYITKRRSSIHGYGVYARCDIVKGTQIIEYVGEKITKREAEKRADRDLSQAQVNSDHGAVYIFVLNNRYDIDGNVAYNTARYINHSCDPNCEAEIDRGKIWIAALRDIKKGEELSYNYGYDLDDYEQHPCKCQSNRCVGFIASEELWPQLKSLLNKGRI